MSFQERTVDVPVQNLHGPSKPASVFGRKEEGAGRPSCHASGLTCQVSGVYISTMVRRLSTFMDSGWHHWVHLGLTNINMEIKQQERRFLKDSGLPRD